MVRSGIDAGGIHLMAVIPHGPLQAFAGSFRKTGPQRQYDGLASLQGKGDAHIPARFTFT